MEERPSGASGATSDNYGVRSYVNSHRGQIQYLNEEFWRATGINKAEIDWGSATLVKSDGANDYVNNGTNCWHLDATLNINKSTTVTVHYVDESERQIQDPFTLEVFTNTYDVGYRVPASLTTSDGTEYELVRTVGYVVGATNGKDVTITAHYTAKAYTVTYRWDNAPAGVRLPEGQEGLRRNAIHIVAERPEDVIEEDKYGNELGRWVFDGWYLDGAMVEGALAITGNTILTGTWTYQETHTAESYDHQVKYEWSGEVPSNAGVLPGSKTVRQGNTYTMADAPTGTVEVREGNDKVEYTVEGWYNEAGERVTGEMKMGDKDVTYYGEWHRTVAKDHYKPALSITKTADQAEAAPGAFVTFTITVENSGDADATGVTITDTLPAGLVNVFGTALEWDDVTIAAGDTWKKEVSGIMVAENAAGTLTNTATVRGNGVVKGTDTATVTVDPSDHEQPDNTFALTVIKKVEGNPPQSDTFDFEVIVDGAKWTEQIKAGERFTVEMTEGQTFSVTEVNIPEGYTTDNGNIAGIAPSGSREVTVTNTYEAPKAPEETANAFELNYHYNVDGVAEPKFPAMPVDETVSTANISHVFTVSGIAPYREGYTFLGWATSSDATAPEFHAKDTVTASVLKPVIDLYAVWQANDSSSQTFTLTVTKLVEGNPPQSDTFDFEVVVDGAKWTEQIKAGECFTVTMTEGQTFSVTEVNIPDGYTTEHGNIAGIAPSGSREVTVTNTYEAQKAPEETTNTFKLRYHYNVDGIEEPKFPAMPVDETVSTANISHVFTVSGIAPYREGYTFLGWSRDKNATVPEVHAKGILTASIFSAKEIDLYAVWKGNDSETYTLTLRKHVVGEDCDPAATSFIVVTKDGVVVKEGRLADGEDLVVEGLKADDKVLVSEREVLEGYTSNIGADGMTVAMEGRDQTVHVINRYEEQHTPADPTYTFTLTYDANGGAFAEADREETFEEYNAKPGELTHDFATRETLVPTREHYLFKGWSLEQDGSEIVKHVRASFLSPDKVAYAVWEAVQYTVTYEDGVHGAAFDTQANDRVFGDEMPGFEGTPSRQGYVFKGWDSTVADTVTGNVTYTATWGLDANNNGEDDATETKYTVTYTDGVEDEEVFQDQGHKDQLSGTSTPRYTNNPDLAAMALDDEAEIPVREGYTFTGWSPEVEETVTGNVTYVAQWEKNPVIAPGQTDPEPSNPGSGEGADDPELSASGDGDGEGEAYPEPTNPGLSTPEPTTPSPSNPEPTNPNPSNPSGEGEEDNPGTDPSEPEESQDGEPSDVTDIPAMDSPERAGNESDPSTPDNDVPATPNTQETPNAPISMGTPATPAAPVVIPGNDLPLASIPEVPGDADTDTDAGADIPEVDPPLADIPGADADADADTDADLPDENPPLANNPVAAGNEEANESANTDVDPEADANVTEDADADLSDEDVPMGDASSEDNDDPDTNL